MAALLFLVQSLFFLLLVMIGLHPLLIQTSDWMDNPGDTPYPFKTMSEGSLVSSKTISTNY